MTEKEFKLQLFLRGFTYRKPPKTNYIKSDGIIGYYTNKDYTRIIKRPHGIIVIVSIARAGGIPFDTQYMTTNPIHILNFLDKKTPGIST